jgi:hypothetical protein
MPTTKTKNRRTKSTKPAGRPEGAQMTFSPQDFQIPFVMSTAPTVCSIGPWGDGKTTMMIMKGLNLSQLYVDNEGLIIRRRFNALQKTTISEFTRWTGLKVPEQKNTVQIPGVKSIIHFSHADNLADFELAIQSMNLGWAAIEQAEELDNAGILDMLAGRVRRILTPNKQIQERLMAAGLISGYIDSFQNYVGTMSKEEADKFTWNVERFIIDKLGLPYHQIILIANAKGHNWLYNRFARPLHENKPEHILKGDAYFEGKPFENMKYIGRSTRNRWEQLKITAPKKYNRFVLNSHEDYDIEGSYYAELMSDALKEKRVECSTLLDITTPVYTFWDLGIHDLTAIWFVQFVGQSVHLVDYYESSGQGMGFYSNVLDEKKYRYAEHWLPHDARSRQQGDAVFTRYDILTRLRKNEDVHIVEKHPIADRIEAVRSILNKCKFGIRCEKGVEHMNLYSREINKLKSTDDKTVFVDRPAKNEHTHGADAFGYMAVVYRYFLAGSDGMVLGATVALPAREDVNGNKKKTYKPLHFFTDKKRKVK